MPGNRENSTAIQRSIAKYVRWVRAISEIRDYAPHKEAKRKKKESKKMKDETNYERGYKDGKRDVLEKIRAEIEDLDPEYNFEGYYQGQVEVLQIIDKYRAERSGEE